MKRVQRRRIAVIEADTAALFEAAINRKYDELSQYSPELVIEHHQPHTAYMFYQYDEYTPEGLADEFHLKGISYKCKNCSYCDIPKKRDGSINRTFKKAYCTQYDRQVLNSFDACDFFYFELINKTGQFAPDQSGLPAPAEAPILPTEKQIADAHHGTR